MTKSPDKTLLVGRLVLNHDGSQDIEPLFKAAAEQRERVLEHQRRVAVLIDAAYAAKADLTPDTVHALVEAATNLE